MIALIAGCGASPAPRQPSTQQSPLLELLARKHAWQLSPVIGEAFDRYTANGGTAHRGRAFYELISLIDRIPRMSALELADLIGAPDLYRILPDGRVIMLYYYRTGSDVRSQRSVVTVDASGRIAAIGYDANSRPPPGYVTP